MDNEIYTLIGANMGKMQMSLLAALSKEVDASKVIIVDSLGHLDGKALPLEMLEDDMKVRFESLKIKASEPELATAQVSCTPDQYNNRAGRRLREKNKRKKGW